MEPTDHPAAAGEPARRPARAMLAAVALAGLATVTAIACSGGAHLDQAGRASEADRAATGTGAEGGGRHTAPNDDGGDRPAEPGVDAVAVADDRPGEGRRRIVLDATVTVQVDDLHRALESAQRAAADAGGFLSAERTDNTSDTDPTATAVYRLPPGAFTPFLDVVAGLGDVRSQVIGSQDLTTEVADLDSRLDTLATSIERLRGFLADATDADQVALLEAELTRRESEAASLTAQRRVIADQVELATVTVSFLSPTAATPVDPSPSGFLRGLRAGVATATALLRSALAVVGFTLPLLPFVLLAAASLRWVRRRHVGGIAPGPPAVP